MDSFDRQWQRWFPEGGSKEPVQPPLRGRTNKIIIIVAAVMILFIILNVLKGFYSEWLWFSSLGYGSVYTTILKTRVLIFFSAAFIFCILFLGNLVLATRLAPSTETHFWPWTMAHQSQRIHKWGVILVTVVLSVIFGLVAQGNWETVLQFFNGQPFGVADSIFHKEVAFYVFSLPFLHFLRSCSWLR